MDTLNGFTFEIDFNECNLNRFNFMKKIKPLLSEFEKNEKIIDPTEFNNIKKFIIEKIKSKIETELIDEKDLVSIYNSKIIKLINRLKEENSNENVKDKIKQLIETPLEGEIPKHNKIKVVTVKIIKRDSFDVLFYTKYKQIEGYNKQIKKIFDTVNYNIIM